MSENSSIVEADCNVNKEGKLIKEVNGLVVDKRIVEYNDSRTIVNVTPCNYYSVLLEFVEILPVSVVKDIAKDRQDELIKNPLLQLISVVAIGSVCNKSACAIGNRVLINSIEDIKQVNLDRIDNTYKPQFIERIVNMLELTDEEIANEVVLLKMYGLIEANKLAVMYIDDINDSYKALVNKAKIYTDDLINRYNNIY
jgi:hypothetical protein